MRREAFLELDRIANEKISSLKRENEELQKRIDLFEAYCRVADSYNDTTHMHVCNCEDLFSTCSQAPNRDQIEAKIRANGTIIHDIELNILPAIKDELARCIN